jgi:hypothetical protein
LQEITVRKADLLDALRKNREQHRAIFEEAIEGYRKKVIERLEEMVDLAKRNKKIDTHLGLVQPEDHTDEYDLAIQMLEMEVGDEIVLSAQEFNQYVRNQWGWQGRFLASNSHYSVMAASMVDGQ